MTWDEKSGLIQTETEILYPLEGDIPQNKIKQYKDTCKTINKQLKDIKEGESITFEPLLVKLKVTENEYRLAVRLIFECTNCVFTKKTQIIMNKKL